MSSNQIGAEVYRSLLAEGGFAWDHRAEGKQTISIHFNRGYSPSPALREMLRDFGDQLKEYVFAMHDEQDRVRRECEERLKSYDSSCKFNGQGVF
jgi:hypothetical protein